MNETALVVREALDPAVLLTDKGMDELLAKIKTEAMSYAFTVEDEQGRKGIASIAFKVARSKTIIIDVIDDSIAEYKKKVTKGNGFKRKVREFMDELKEEVREPLATYEAEQDRIKAEEDRKEREKVDARIVALAQVGCVIGSFEVTAMTDEEFTEKLATVTAEHEEIQRIEREARIAAEAARNAEEEKLATERAELEANRKTQEAEAARLREFNDKILAEQKAAQDKIDAERKTLEAAKEAERDRIYRARFEVQARENARIQAERFEKTAAEKIVIEAREKREAEEREVAEKERRAALLPDYEKLEAFAQYLQEGITYPELQSEDEDAKTILKNARIQIYDIGNEILEELEII